MRISVAETGEGFPFKFVPIYFLTIRIRGGLYRPTYVRWHMAEFSAVLLSFKSALCLQVDVGGLFARSATAYKWKAPWRALLLREAVAWRLQDLLEQSLSLSRAGHILGARILLRSAFETLAMLIYLNRSMRSVVAGNLEFHTFSEQTTRLLLGSRDKTTTKESISILTVLNGANK